MDLDPRLVATMTTQGGMITLPQARAGGLEWRDVQSRLRSGVWIALRRGVYIDATAYAAAQSIGERRRLFDRAGCLRIDRPFVRSHETAALELELPLLVPPGAATHVTRPGIVGSHLIHGVKHHLAPYRMEDVTLANGFRVLGPARTAIDIAREHGHPYGVVAVDAARQRGVTAADLQAILELMHHWPHRRSAVQAVDLSDPGAESIGETLLRMLVLELGLGEVETQFELRDGRRHARFDLRVGRQLFEFDGNVKYDDVDNGGLADRPVTTILREEKARQDWAVGFQLGMSRVGWADVWGPGRATAGARLRREYAATERLWGTSIDDLAPYIVRRSAA